MGSAEKVPSHYEILKDMFCVVFRKPDMGKKHTTDKSEKKTNKITLMLPAS